MVEPTPNPLAFKLRIDQQVTTGGSRNYLKKDDAYDNPLAQKFFGIHGVESLFFMDDFITINKTAGGIWDYIFFQANEVLMGEKNIAPVKGDGAAASGGADVTAEDFDKLSNDEKLAVIDRIIDQTIRPGLARDGGGLELLGLEGYVLKVKYQGACGSCPSSTAQTLNYINSMLQTRVSPHLTVMPA
jgi:Fe-S cluster biogenesis protein NfuA